MKCHFFCHDDSATYNHPRFTHATNGMYLHAGIGASEHLAFIELQDDVVRVYLHDCRQFILQQLLSCFQILAARATKPATEYFCDGGHRIASIARKRSAQGLAEEERWTADGVECAFKSQNPYLAILFINFFA